MPRKSERDTNDSTPPSPAPAGSTHAGDSGAAIAARDSDSGPSCNDDIDVWRRKVESIEDALLRSRAELQNVQRRALLEKTDAIRYANTEVFKSLLSVLDDLERALQSASADALQSAFVSGVRLARDNFWKTLQQFGIEEIESHHARFDPLIHHALMQQPTDELPPGTVLETAVKGYRFKDRVLRPAMVVVSKECTVTN